VTPPAPTGPAPVGFTRSTLTDTHRTEKLAGETGSRRLPIRVWYPAAGRGARAGARWLRGHSTVTERGLSRPFAVVQGDGPFAAYASLRKFRSHLRGPHPYLHVPGAAHYSFTDNVWLVPQLGLDPAESDVGTVDPARAVRQQNAFLLRFFDRYVGLTSG
jgi:hypothetical protein